MGRDTKLAIVVAVVFVGFGAWYIFSGTTSDTGSTGSQEQAKSVAANKPAAELPKPHVPLANKPAQPPSLQPPAPTPPAHLTSGSPSASLSPNNEPDPQPSLATPPTPAALASPIPGPVGTDASASPPAAAVAARHDTGITPPANGATAPPGLAPATRPAGVGTVAPDRVVGLTPPGASKSINGAAAHPLAKPGEKTTALAPAAGVAPIAAAGDAKTHTVVAGDSFSALAAKYLGHAKYTDLIAKANPDIDPRRLQIGAKIKIPPAPVQSAAAASPTVAAVSTPSASTSSGLPAVAPAKAPIDLRPGQQTYTVKAGESWYSLARRFLGGEAEWVRLYELNKERIPNRERLAVGTVIVLPEDAKVPATSDGAKTPPKTLTDSSMPSKP